MEIGDFCLHGFRVRGKKIKIHKRLQAKENIDKNKTAKNAILWSLKQSMKTSECKKVSMGVRTIIPPAP